MTHDHIAHSPPAGHAWSAAHRLEEHLAAVAREAARAAEAFGAGEWAWHAGLWHDLGKYTQAFQRYLRGEGARASHKLAGAALARRQGDQAVGPLLALVIAGHHRGLPAWHAPTGALADKLADAERELTAADSNGAPPALLNARPPARPEPIMAQMAALSPGDRKLYLELLVRLLFSALVDADYRDTAAFYDPPAEASRAEARQAQSDMATLARRLDAAIDALAAQAPPGEVNRWRRTVLEQARHAAEAPPGVFELTVPTGGGKTLASLSFALRHAARHGLRRVVVVLPYTAIIEQNAAIYRRHLGDENVIEHHSAWDPERAWRDLEPGARAQAVRRCKLAAENWDAPVIVTTSVQLLESLHHHRPSTCRKLHNLARSVVVLDEVQTLPVALLAATLDTLRVLAGGFGVTLVCCTATQPALTRRTDGAGYVRHGLGTARPIVPDAPAAFAALRRVHVHWPADLARPTSWDELAAELARHPRVLAIVHRRQDARELAERLAGAWHLSAAMLPAHRSRVLDKVRHRLATPGAPCRVVATQLVEAGVDLDFPVVYRALAGVDSLAQAAGRCNREGREPRPGSFHVFVAPTPPPPGILTQARDTCLALLRENGGTLDLDDPHLYRRFYARLYDSTPTDPHGLQALRNGLHTRFPELAERYRVVEEEGRMPVVVPWPKLKAATLAAIARLRRGHAGADELRLILRASVSVPTRIVLAWAARGIVSVPRDYPLPVLNIEAWPDVYQERYGLDPHADPEIPAANWIT